MLSEDAQIKSRKTMKDLDLFGHTNETKAKISNSLLGHFVSTETKLKISKSLLEYFENEKISNIERSV